MAHRVVQLPWVFYPTLYSLAVFIFWSLSVVFACMKTMHCSSRMFVRLHVGITVVGVCLEIFWLFTWQRNVWSELQVAFYYFVASRLTAGFLLDHYRFSFLLQRPSHPYLLRISPNIYTVANQRCLLHNRYQLVRVKVMTWIF